MQKRQWLPTNSHPNYVTNLTSDIHDDGCNVMLAISTNNQPILRMKRRRNCKVPAHPEIIQAIKELWRLQWPGPDNLFSEPKFVHLRETCQSLYPKAGSAQTLDFALSTALRAFGLPCNLASRDTNLALPIELIAEHLDRAFRQVKSKQFHLCPLDCADNLPALNFGPNSVRKLSQDELEMLVNLKRLKRINSSWIFDIKRFSEFHWLVVEESVQHAGEPNAREIRSIFDGFDLSRDLGEILPHKNQFPLSVERALFALLLVPWEDMTTYRDLDWRGFRIPWVYTVSEDIFTRPAPPPSPDTLSWEPKCYQDEYGNRVEEEGPVKLPLVRDIAQTLSWLDDACWDNLCAARTSPIFATPIEHFFVRAFLNDDIDEFLAHVTVIEAALGMKKDFTGKERPQFRDPKNQSNKNSGPTVRVANRLSNLLKRTEAADEFHQLFGLRSEFLHGRKMAPISSYDKNLARRLAREVICELISSALATPTPSIREEYLDNLLTKT